MPLPRRVAVATLVVLTACGDGSTPPDRPALPEETLDVAAVNLLLEGLTQFATANPFIPDGAPVSARFLSPSAARCPYAAGRYTCPPVSFLGDTARHSFAFRDAAGAPQRAYDQVATASVVHGLELRVSSAAWDRRVDGERSFALTLGGLLGRETRQVIDGTASARRRVITTYPSGARTVTTVAADTVRAVEMFVVEHPTADRPLDPDNTPLYPLGGSVTSVLRYAVTDSGTVPLPREVPARTRVVTTLTVRPSPA